jgi:hypothetical protein
MNKKLWIGFIVVFILMGIFSFVVHGLILSSVYRSEAMRNIWRSDMESKMWIYYLVYLFISFFFVLIYSKWNKGKGIAEGIQYGVYVGFMMSVPMAYSTYAMIPMPYSVTVQWFIYGLIQYIIYGIVVAMIIGKKAQENPV